MPSITTKGSTFYVQVHVSSLVPRPHGWLRRRPRPWPRGLRWRLQRLRLHVCRLRLRQEVHRRHRHHLRAVRVYGQGQQLRGHRRRPARRHRLRGGLRVRPAVPRLRRRRGRPRVQPGRRRDCRHVHHRHPQGEVRLLRSVLRVLRVRGRQGRRRRQEPRRPQGQDGRRQDRHPERRLGRVHQGRLQPDHHLLRPVRHDVPGRPGR